MHKQKLYLHWTKLNQHLKLETLISSLSTLLRPVILINAHPFQNEPPWAILSHSPLFLWQSYDRENLFYGIQGIHNNVTYENPWVCIEQIYKQYELQICQKPPFPFWGGFIGYLGYSLTPYAMDIKLRPKRKIYPDAELGFYHEFIQINLTTNEGYYGWLSDHPEISPSLLIEKSEQYIQNIYQHSPRKKSTHYSKPIQSLDTYTSYEKKIEQIQNLIQKGTVYQINYTRPFETETSLSSLEIFQKLLKNNPEPYMALLGFETPDIVMASPERFLYIKDNYIQTRPIKGTRPRHINVSQDYQNALDLQNSAKDQAELTMIVDLERNDLGKVCDISSINVEQNLTLEKHPTVYHLSSTISGKIKNDLGLWDVIRACFPGGSITGAPKHQAIQEIDQLEEHAREIYTGALGYIDLAHHADLAMIIRGLYKIESKIKFFTGGGIVIDSDARSEYNETYDKACALFDCLETTKERKENVAL